MFPLLIADRFSPGRRRRLAWVTVRPLYFMLVICLGTSLLPRNFERKERAQNPKILFHNSTMGDEGLEKIRTRSQTK